MRKKKKIKRRSILWSNLERSNCTSGNKSANACENDLCMVSIIPDPFCCVLEEKGSNGREAEGERLEESKEERERERGKEFTFVVMKLEVGKEYQLYETRGSK